MPQPGTRPTVLRILGVLAIVALALFWQSAWRDLDRTVLTRVPILDEAYYLREAADISGGRVLPDDPFIMSPLYPYLVAAAGSGREIGPDQLRVGQPPLGIRVLQAGLWLGTAILLWRVARRTVPARFAWLAPVLWLFYRPGAVFVTSVLLEVPLSFLTVASLAVATGGTPTRRRALAAGALAALAALLRFHAVLLIVPVVLALTGDFVGRRPWRRAVPAVLAMALLVMPVTLFNSARAGRLVGPSLNGGINLYIGNGPEAEGFYMSYRGFDPARDPTGRAFLSDRLGVDVIDAAAADRAWASRARAAIVEDPVRALGLWLKKIRLHIVAAEFSQISPLGSWAREAPALRLLVVPYGLLTAGGLFGLLLLGLRDKRLRPWVIALLLLIATQSVFFVVSRYRLVLVPVLALLTTAGVAELARRRGRSLVLGVGLAVVCVLAVIPWGLAPSLRRLEAAGLLNEGVRWEHLGGADDRALSLYTKARELDPVHPEVYRAAARVHLGAGRHSAAEEVLRGGLGAADPVTDVRRDLIDLLLSEDRAAEAVDYLGEHVDRHPRDVDMLHNLAVALADVGRGEDAESVASDLISVAPDDPRGYIDLGIIMARQGRLEEARATFREGLAHCRDDARFLANLDRVERMLTE